MSKLHVLTCNVLDQTLLILFISTLANLYRLSNFFTCLLLTSRTFPLPAFNCLEQQFFVAFHPTFSFHAQGSAALSCLFTLIHTIHHYISQNRLVIITNQRKNHNFQNSHNQIKTPATFFHKIKFPNFPIFIKSCCTVSDLRKSASIHSTAKYNTTTNQRLTRYFPHIFSTKQIFTKSLSYCLRPW